MHKPMLPLNALRAVRHLSLSARLRRSCTSKVRIEPPLPEPRLIGMHHGGLPESAKSVSCSFNSRRRLSNADGAQAPPSSNLHTIDAAGHRRRGDRIVRFLLHCTWSGNGTTRTKDGALTR